MSTFKGTPGPWGPHPRAHACVISSDEILIANCGGHSSNMRDQGELIAEQEANARLIAAAPDLLEACHQALVFVAAWAGVYQHNHGLPDFHPRHKEAIEQVKYAIAKATGGVE